MSTFNEPVAIIGSGCRFPGESSSPSKLWDLLRSPRDVSRKIDRFQADSFYHESSSHHGTSNVLHSYLLSEDTRAFDAQFFNIQGGEAGSIDPQQRFLMEVIYESLESAGQKIEELSGTSTGVYVGVMCNDFSQVTYADIENVPKYAATGTALSILSNRISYFFNWTGPSMTIDTACSSSLFAVHHAVQLLRSGQSRLAVAAGSNLIFTPINYITESNVQMLSPTGRSRMWDADADGYARGEGVGSVVLKLLRDAIADGDEIECVIRETGINQDGRTRGITMPSSESQAELIRQTYSRAGLDPLLETDRCQFFEAHGTGTPAGDPQEAGAIYTAFRSDRDSAASRDVLYVGSIKTVIGHTEGTAGIAGLLKAALGVKHGVIPANMLFTELNPDIEPYYGFLQIPTTTKAWPAIPPGVPRRASVNSFGFGGSNAHAIVESYTPTSEKAVRRSSTVAIPFLFSANSEKALVAQLKSHLNFLEHVEEGTNARDVAWTLSCRSTFACRTSFSASTLESLYEKLKQAVDAKEADNIETGIRPLSKRQKIFGVFTGQGAQWPMMGYNLIQSSPVVHATAELLDKSLQSLPEEDRPSWSLIEELSKSPGVSRVMQAELSQPLCTAVQIFLVDILHTAGVGFNAVVGHSSGEIGAAYACGYLTASDAIRVAYYRGRLASLANADGAMLAAGTSMEDATELCELSVFRGRIKVAASNSSASVTLSGDKNAIERAQSILEDEGKPARILKVDKAYHSHHMEPCAEPYMQAMSRVKIQVQKPTSSCKWFSSVLGGAEVDWEMAGRLSGSYWRDNLLQPVLFSQALEAALEGIGAPGLSIEVGPHPALKGPASLVIEEKYGSDFSYTGVLARGSGDMESLSAGIGNIWCNIWSPALQLADLDALFSCAAEDKPAFLKSVPTYTWDHDRTYWTESRTTKALFGRPERHHELLGVRLDGGENDFRWRNFIKPAEIPWLRGHHIQGQMVFPGAGFASMAFEACKALVHPDRISLIELLDLRITRSLSLTDENAGVESMVSLTNVVRDEQNAVVTCDYECCICPTADSSPVTASTGRIRLEIGASSADSLPARCQSDLELNDVEMDQFYGSLSALGYNYSNMFTGLSSLKRATDTASGVIHVDGADGYNPPFTFHPAPLDVALQSVFGALSSPGDGRLWTILVPTLISRIKINPHACQSAGLGNDLPFDCVISVSPSNGISGDIEIFDDDGKGLVQIEGLHVSPLTTLTNQDDRQMFSMTEWGPAEPDATRGFTKWTLSEEVHNHMVFIERACFFYMKRLHDTITDQERENCEWHPRKYLAWVAEIVDEVSAGRHPIVQREWMNDTWDEMSGWLESFSKLYKDFYILMVLGVNLIPWVRGEVSFLEMFRESGMLEHIYKNTYGFPEYNAYLGGLVQQLTHRFRQMDIVEFGAGTGSGTEAIMSRIGDNYGSYTYTDISAGFFVEAQSIFKEQADKFTYATLDVEKDPVQQGYAAHSYDLVVASNVLHATKSLEQTLSNVRKLLKPGGYLVILEITDVKPLRPTFFFGSLPTWWVGEADGRPHHPLITQDGWEAVLQKTGFSGLDTATPPSGEFMVPQSIMLSQAIDTQMKLIRQPFAPENNVALDDLLVIGGQSMSTFQLQEDIMALLQPLVKNVTCVEKLEHLEDSHFTSKQIVLGLVELDEPVFSHFTPAKWAGFQCLPDKARNIVWITKGGRGEQPYANMVVGVARCLTDEKPELRFQIIDFDVEDDPDPKMIADSVMRMQISDAWSSLIEPYTPTWTLEREIRVVNGDVTIPRYIASRKRDDRYNSSRRTVRSDIDLESFVVAVSSGETAYELEEVTTPSWALPTHPDVVDIQVERSSLATLDLGSVGSLFLVVGKIIQHGQKILAFSETNGSKVSVPKSWTIACDESEGEDSSFLLTAFNVCLSVMVISKTAQDMALLVHEPTRPCALALQKAAEEQGIALRCTTSKHEKTRTDLQYVHPSTRGRAISALFPKNLDTFVDMSGKEDEGSIAARIEKQLPIQCDCVKISALMGRNAFVRPSASDNTIRWILERVLRYTNVVHGIDDDNMAERVEDSGIEEIGIADMAGRSISRLNDDLTSVVNWTAHNSAPVRLLPPENTVRFRPDKTYWLVGLSGELGLSLCQWMVRRDARHIVVTSRNPKVSEAWLDHVQSGGAEVRFLACDVTDRRSVMQTYRTICKTMPPIAGVANGAMILNDGIVGQMSHEEFNQTLRPKVDGTRFLNEIFTEPTLDFFIVFSSLAYVTGNIGQSSYAAANAFMASVVEGRRKRGLAGSVMNLAGIFGIGYITRTDRGIIERLGKMGYSNVSEWDFQQFFAEAVMAGNPATGSGSDYEISSSLRPYDPDRDDKPPSWVNIPRFSYYKRAKTQAKGLEDGKKISVRAQLKEQTTKEGVYKVLLTGLTATLYEQLGLRPEDNIIAPHTRLIDLGIDSLVAVDMRFWFSKELDLDMPVLKLLGGASVEEMVDDTLERLSVELIPNVREDAAATATAAASVSGPDSVPTQNSTSDESTPVDSSKVASTNGDGSSLSTPPPTSDALDVDDDKIETNAEKYTEAKTEKELVFERKMKMAYPPLQFWFLMRHMAQDAPCAFNFTFRVPLTGRMDVGRMERAVRTLGERHDSLRTAFFDDLQNGNDPTQGVLPISEAPLRLEVLKVANLQEVIDFTDRLRNYVFDVQRGRNIRMALLSESDFSHHLILGFHHIALDGFSFDVFLRELTAAYDERPMPPVAAQWNDLMAEQRLAVDNGSLKNEIEFWKNTLSHIPDPIPMLPMARTRSRVPITEYAFEEPPVAILDEKTVRAVRERCRVLKVTRFHFFMAVLRIMLFELTGVEELCIGAVDANRQDSRSSNIIGLMVNVLPLMFQRKAGQSFAQSTLEARDKAYASLAHSRLPFKALLDQLAVPRSTHCTPIFQVMFDYLPHKIEFPEGLGTPADEIQATLNYTLADMVIHVNDISATEIRFRWRAQKSLYSLEGVQIMQNMFTKLVKKFAAVDPKLPVNSKNLELYNPVQVQAAMEDSLGPSMESRWAPTVSHVIDENCARHSDAPALKDGFGNSLTYAQTSKRVDQIAGALLASGIVHERVASYQEPTVDWICSLLAVWKIGAAYVTLHSGLPESRIASLLASSKPSALLCNRGTLQSATAVHGDVLLLDVSSLPPLSTTNSVPPVSTKAERERPALMVFTSGSTGTPKAVEARHSSLVNVIEGLTARHGFDEEVQVVLQHSAQSFDICFGQVLLGLCNGGSVFVVPEDKRGDPLEVCKMIRDEKITLCISTPAEYAHWLRFGLAELREADSWKYGFTCGESMSNSLKAAFSDLGNQVTLISAYGPAEAVILSTTTVIDSSCVGVADSREHVPIGKPLPNYGVFVVDNDMKPVPCGVAGEIVITGAGIANGYYGQEELSKAAFVPDTLTPTGYSPQMDNHVQMKMYRTGDSGRYDQDGQLHFEGRIAGDSQIKLHGIRMEVKEIEAVIVESSAGVLREAFVSVRRNPDFLVGHVDFATSLDAAEQNAFLASLLARLPLPKYMCPALLVPLENVPVNAHGKIDRRAIQELPLPETTHDGVGTVDEPVLTETDQALKDIWIEVLPEECTRGGTIRAETEFFSLGGGSYLLVLIQGLIRKRFQVSIPLIQLFNASSLREMASKISATASAAAIDWDAETALEKGLEVGTRAREEDRQGSSSGALTVVFTGATGYLGRNILKALRKHSSVSRIYCVAVRGEGRVPVQSDNSEADTGAQTTVYTGDLSAALLGLPAETFDMIAQTADVIIHCGANRSFWDYYQTLRGPNVNSTKTLVKMAAVGRTPLHFISSGGLVSTSSNDDKEGAHNIISPGLAINPERIPPTDGSNGYLASKWASEAYLERAGRELGLPVYIHRVTGARRSSINTTSPSSTAGPSLSEDMLAEFVNLAAKLKAIPETQGWYGSFDVVRTSELSRRLVGEFTNAAGKMTQRVDKDDGTVQASSPLCDTVHYVHYPSEACLQLEDVVRRLDDATLQVATDGKGVNGDNNDNNSSNTADGFEMLPPHIWVGRAKQAGIDWHFSSQDFDAAGSEQLALKR